MDVAHLDLAGDAVPNAMAGVDTVGFGRRVAARLVDLVIHVGVVLATAAVIALAVGQPLEPMVRKATSEMWTFVLSVFGFNLFFLFFVKFNLYMFGFNLYMLGFVLYSSICDGLFGGTAGKYLLGMAVLSKNGERCTYGQALARSFAFVFDHLFVGLVAYWSMKDSATDQRYGDRLAGTVVVTRASAPAGVLRGPRYFIGAFLLAIVVDGSVIVAALMTIP